MGDFKFKISMDKFNIEVEGKGSETLKEINSILDKVLSYYFEDYDDQLDEFTQKAIKEYSAGYSEYRAVRTSIKNSNTIELEKGDVKTHIDTDNARKRIEEMMEEIDKSKAENAAFQIKSSIPEEEIRKLKDFIEKELPNININFKTSKKEVKCYTIIEGVIFGDFPQLDNTW